MRRGKYFIYPTARKVIVITWLPEPPEPGLHDQALAMVVTCSLVKVKSMVVASFLLHRGKKVNSCGVFWRVNSCRSVYSPTM